MKVQMGERCPPTHMYTHPSLLSNCESSILPTPFMLGGMNLEVSHYSCRNVTAAMNVFCGMLKSGASRLMICKLNSPGCKMHWDSFLCQVSKKISWVKSKNKMQEQMTSASYFAKISTVGFHPP